MSVRLLGLSGVLAVLLIGCAAEEAPVTTPVTVVGAIRAPEGVGAGRPVTVNLYHAWALEGPLRHPLEFIGSFPAAVGEFRHAFDYPVELGEGLVVYAWLDTDGDGVLCTPTGRTDIAGLTVADAFPAAEVALDIELSAPCAGPDWFFPAVPALSAP